MIAILEIVVNRIDFIDPNVIRNDEAVNDVVLRVGTGFIVRLIQ